MNKILTLLFLLTSNFLMAQAWEIIEETTQYKIEKMHIICKSSQGFDYDYVVLRFSNLTNQEIELSFNFETWNENGCSNCNNPDLGTFRKINLLPLQVIEGNCDYKKDYLSVFHHSLTDHPNAFKSKLVEIKIQKVNVQTK